MKSYLVELITDYKTSFTEHKIIWASTGILFFGIIIATIIRGN